MSILEMNRFILKHEKVNFRETFSILDASMNPVCYAKVSDAWKRPNTYGIPLAAYLKANDVKFENISGELVGEIHEIPTGTLRLIRVWEIYSEKGELLGAVKEKPKIVGSDWLLQDTQGNTIAVAEGDKKKHNYEVVTPDRYKQTIARCSKIDETSYEVNVMLSNFNAFLILSYIIVLDLPKMQPIIRGVRPL